MSWVLVTLLGCVAVLLLDAVAALIARPSKQRYQLFAPLSFALYSGTGYLAAAQGEVALVGALARACLGAVDSTLGWRLSWRLGVGSQDEVSEGVEIGTAALVTVLAAVVGGLAGLLA